LFANDTGLFTADRASCTAVLSSFNATAGVHTSLTKIKLQKLHKQAT